MPPIDRRSALRASLWLAIGCAASLHPRFAWALRVDPDPLSRDNVLNDAAISVAGNPRGDVAIVEYFDYQCPY
jgi:hypothetical protein